jgi:hypothetical protein
MSYILGIVRIATLLNPLMVELYYLARQSPNTGLRGPAYCIAVVEYQRI